MNKVLPPDQDIAGRRAVWGALQGLWLDTDPSVSLQRIAEQCAHSRYSIAELEQIYWNEVRPALRSNLHSVAGEWAGFDQNWLCERILKKHRFGRRLPIRALHHDVNHWWKKLKAAVERIRAETRVIPPV